MKTAVVLVNWGGPESQRDIQPFLFNRFNDLDLIKLPFGKKGQSFFARIRIKFGRIGIKISIIKLGSISTVLHQGAPQN